MGTERIKWADRYRLLVAAGFSLFWVLFLWRFWEEGIWILGLNAVVFLGGLFYYFVILLASRRRLDKADFFWIIPIGLIILSYLFYDNPFLKLTNILVLPLVFLVFYSQAQASARPGAPWGISLVFALIERAFSFFSSVPRALGDYLRLLSLFRGKSAIVFRVLLGLLLFFVIAGGLFLPLLSSADPVFAGKIDFIYRWLQDLFDMPWVARVFVFIIFSLGIASLFLALVRPLELKATADGSKFDQLIASIVLGGILLLYFLFIWVQLERLFGNTLPIDFRQTEQFVKSGFWQLLFLSLINIAIHLASGRNRQVFFRRLLSVFAFASLLLLFSAAQRMFLYVYYYGFSYEKFFAAYAVIYCLIFFSWLIYGFIRRVEQDLLRFLCQLFLLMYALACISPVEQLILRSNMALAKRPDSRIVLYELNMLSPDVLATIKRKTSTGELSAADWRTWIEKQEQILSGKRWYETNLNSWR
jgi:hypothetical protein